MLMTITMTMTVTVMVTMTTMTTMMMIMMMMMMMMYELQKMTFLGTAQGSEGSCQISELVGTQGPWFGAGASGIKQASRGLQMTMIIITKKSNLLEGFHESKMLSQCKRSEGQW